MKSIEDVTGWIIGALFTFVFFAHRNKVSADAKEFAALKKSRDEMALSLASLEARVSFMHDTYIKHMEDIQSIQRKMAQDVVDIKIAVAGLPKRREDD